MRNQKSSNGTRNERMQATAIWRAATIGETNGREPNQ